MQAKGQYSCQKYNLPTWLYLGMIKDTNNYKKKKKKEKQVHKSGPSFNTYCLAIGEKCGTNYERNLHPHQKSLSKTTSNLCLIN